MNVESHKENLSNANPKIQKKRDKNVNLKSRNSQTNKKNPKMMNVNQDTVQTKQMKSKEERDCKEE